MNIVFMGTPEFAVPPLEAIFHSNHKILSVVTAPDKPRGRGLKLSQSAVKKFASENNLNILQPLKLKDENFINQIKELHPDLIVIIAFRILPAEVFTIPQYGSVNLHASLLPKYRGAAPINWAIINGEKETGVTTFFLKEKVDTGNIILQEKCKISDDDNAGTLHDKLAQLGIKVIKNTLDLIEENKGNVKLLKQDESLASAAPKIFRDNCKIQWDTSVNKVHNLIRGLSPYPGAFTIYNGKALKIFSSSLENSMDIGATPGEIIINDEKMFVSCNDGVIEITGLQLEGGRRMNISEFLRGHDIENGHILGLV